MSKVSLSEFKNAAGRSIESLMYDFTEACKLHGFAVIAAVFDGPLGYDIKLQSNIAENDLGRALTALRGSLRKKTKLEWRAAERGKEN